MRPRVKKVKAIENYILVLEFENGEIKYFDVKPYLEYKAFEELKDINKFNKVRVSGLSIEWENGADICPDELYNSSYIDN